MNLRHVLSALLATLALLGAACVEPGPNNPRNRINLVVVGDSWAQGAGNSNGVAIPGITIPGTDPVEPQLFRSGHNKAKPSFNTTIDFAANTNPDTYFAASSFSSWGFGGTRASGWVDGPICSSDNVHPADPGCSYLHPDNRSLDFGAMMEAELATLPADEPTLVYLSLGLNDIKDVAYLRDPETGEFDLNDIDERNTATAEVAANLTTFVTRLTSANPNVEVVIAGYTPFRVNGSVGGTQCRALWELLMPGTAVTQETLNAFVTGIGNDAATQGNSMRDVYETVAAAHPRVYFADVPNSINPANEGEPPGVGKWADCLHLNASGFDAHTSAVFASWAAQRT